MEFYVVETASGREIPAEEGGGIWPSWHEARVAAEKLGTGYKADDRTVLV